MFISDRLLALATIVLAVFVAFGNETRADLTLTEEQAFNPTGGPFSSGLVILETSNSSSGPGTLTINPDIYANVTTSTISQYIDGSFSYEPFNGIIIDSAATDPIFTSVTVTGISASYGNPNYPGPFTASDVTFNDHEIALNYQGISLVGTVSLSFTTATVIPEPSSIILSGIAAGLAGLVVASSRMRDRSRGKAIASLGTLE